MISKGKRPQEQFLISIYTSPTTKFNAVIELENWEWVGGDSIEKQWDFRWTGYILNPSSSHFFVEGSSKDIVYNKLIQLLIT